MGHPDHGAREPHVGGEGWAVQVHEVAAHLCCERRNRSPRLLDLGTAAGRPVKRKSGLDQMEPPDGVRRCALCLGRRGSEDGNRDLRTSLGKPGREVKRVGPHAANGIGRH
jgi:hypothetical protein